MSGSVRWQSAYRAWNGILLHQGTLMLRYARTRFALSLAERVLNRCERLTSSGGAIPPEFERDYASALLLHARALAQNHAPTAAFAYLRARQWIALEPADVEFVAG